MSAPCSEKRARRREEGLGARGANQFQTANTAADARDLSGGARQRQPDRPRDVLRAGRKGEKC